MLTDNMLIFVILNIENKLIKDLHIRHILLNYISVSCFPNRNT